MKFLNHVVALLAVALVFAILVGVTLQVLWFGLLALIVVGAVAFLTNKGKPRRRIIDATPVEARLEAPRNMERVRR